MAHLYQRILDKEAHVKNIASVFTLAAYMHYKLTGQKVIGVGDAAGMFPIDSDALDYDSGMCEKFDALILKSGHNLKLREIFPKVLVAGDNGVAGLEENRITVTDFLGGGAVHENGVFEGNLREGVEIAS